MTVRSVALGAAAALGIAACRAQGNGNTGTTGGTGAGPETGTTMRDTSTSGATMRDTSTSGAGSAAADSFAVHMDSARR